MAFLLTTELTLPLGIVINSSFHVANSYLFQIGTFPSVMLSTNFLFFSKPILSYLPFFGSSMILPEENRKPKPKPKVSKLTFTLIAIFVIVHLLLPLRHHLYQGNVNWTMQGHLFSWRMMLNNEEVMMKIYRTEEDGKNLLLLSSDALALMQRQIKRMLTTPDMIPQLIHFLKKRDGGRYRYYVEAWKSLNSRLSFLSPSLLLKAPPWLFQIPIISGPISGSSTAPPTFQRSLSMNGFIHGSWIPFPIQTCIWTWLTRKKMSLLRKGCRECTLQTGLGWASRTSFSILFLETFILVFWWEMQPWGTRTPAKRGRRS